MCLHGLGLLSTSYLYLVVEEKMSKSEKLTTLLWLCRFCFLKLNLLLVALEIAGDDGVDATIAINPDSNVKIDLNFQGFFIAESADDVKRYFS